MTWIKGIVISVVSVLVCSAGWLLLILFSNVSNFHVKDGYFVDQKYHVYQVFEDGVICLYVPKRNGYVCKGIPPEFFSALNTIFDADMFKATEMKAGSIEKVIEEASAVHGVDPKLAKAVAKVESNYRADATSPKGCKGVMQICTYSGESDLYNPVINVYVGVQKLKELIDEFGDEKLALAAYNSGPTSVHRYGGVPPYKETREYIKKVLRVKNEM